MVRATSEVSPKISPEMRSSSAVPVSPLPSRPRSRNPTPTPTKVMTVPEVGTMALATISRSRGTTCGSEAPSAVRKNRLTASTPSAAA